MASGHVCRANRPNTWLHRPPCGREDSPCQPGAVHTWHFSDVPARPLYLRYWGYSGRQMLAASWETYGNCEDCTGNKGRLGNNYGRLSSGARYFRLVRFRAVGADAAIPSTI